MIAFHLPILLMVLGSLVIDGCDLDRVGSACSLVAALAFFVLKLNDVSFLRLQSGQQAIIAFGLLIAIAHHGAIERQLGEEAAAPAVAAIVIGAGVVAGWRSRRTLGDRIRDSLIRQLGARVAEVQLVSRLEMSGDSGLSQHDVHTIAGRGPPA